MDEKKHILLVEDDANLSFMIKDHLEYCGYAVDCTGIGEEAIALIEQKDFDLMVLDIELEGALNGFDVATCIRANKCGIPIVFTTCHSSSEDLNRIFNFGNINYVRKPFNLSELVLRMNQFFERPEKKTQTIYIGGMSLNLEERRIYYRDEKYNLPNYELKLLLTLLEQTNRVVPKVELLKAIWPDSVDLKSKEFSLNNLVSALRKVFKLADSRVSIDTIRRRGYKLTIR